MFSLVISKTKTKFSLEKLVTNLKNIKRKLVDSRIEIDPELYDSYLQNREVTHKKAPRECITDADTLYPGTWYLKSIDSNYKRTYARINSSIENDKININKASKIIIDQLTLLKNNS